MKEYKKAESQGAYIDRLRVKYPFYRFPGGTCCQNPFENGITIIEY